MWVPVWFRRMASRRGASTFAVASCPGSMVPSTTMARWRCRPGSADVGDATRLLGPAPLLGHGHVEPGAVDVDASLGGQLLGQLDRKPVGVVQLEGGLAGNGPRSQRLFQQHRTRPQGVEKALL